MKTFDQFILTEKVLSKSQAFEKFIFGDCAAFAVALQLQIGGEFYAVYETKHSRYLHVFIKLDGKTIDVGGFRPVEKMIADFVGTGYDKSRFEIKGPFDITALPLKVKPKAVETATEYILANKRTFNL